MASSASGGGGGGGAGPPPAVMAVSPQASPRLAQTARSTAASRRPLSRGSLESTLAELGEVSRGIGTEAGQWEAEPENPLRRPFWLLRLVRATVTRGGFITPRLHVPRLVWEMWGAKLGGYTVKTNAFESVLTLLIDRVLPLERPGGPADLARAQRALRVFQGLRAEFDSLQNQLARPFPFIREVPSVSAKAVAGAGGAGAGGTTASPSSLSTSSSSSSAAGAEGGGGGGGLANLRSMVLSIGKHVKKSAVSAYTAYERIGVAVPAKITDEELVAYASLVHEVCDKAQSLDDWFAHLDAQRRRLQEELRSRGNAAAATAGNAEADERLLAFYQVVEQILVELLHCARFLQEVVVELLLRDLEVLMGEYLRKMRKSFARMTWELEEAAEA